jgi:hypothetical protein
VSIALRAQLLVATLTAVAAAVIVPEFRHVFLGLWLLAVLTYALAAVVSSAWGLVGRRPSAIDVALAPTNRRPGRPADLVRCERIFGWGSYASSDFDDTVRPALRALINARLETDGAASPPADELHVLLGDTPAEAVYGRVVTSRDLERIVEQMEAL